MKVSVCVPAYERPSTIVSLIETINAQTYSGLELVISDDSRSSSVEEVIRSECRVTYQYRRNAQRLGFATNLKQALSMASGDMVIILGDDDCFTEPWSVARYVEVACEFPSVGFSYGNLTQIDGAGNVSLIHRYFEDDRLMRAGPDAFRSLWLRSVQIAGMCFHMPGADVVRFFPEFDSLFPQVIAAGHVLATRNGFAHGSLLVGTRVSESQLGYQVAKRAQPMSARASLGGAELLEILTEIRATYPDQIGSDVRGQVERQILRGFVGSLPNMRLYCRRRDILRMYHGYLVRSRRIWVSLTAMSVCAAVIVLPRSVIRGCVALLKPLWLWWTRLHIGVDRRAVP